MTAKEIINVVRLYDAQDKEALAGENLEAVLVKSLNLLLGTLQMAEELDASMVFTVQEVRELAETCFHIEELVAQQIDAA